jgi:hypothetical protein
MLEEMPAFVGLDLIQDCTQAPPKLIITALSRLAQERLPLGEHGLDRIQVRAVRGQLSRRSPVGFNKGLDLRYCRGRQRSTDHAIAGL